MNRSILIVTPYFAPQSHAAVFRAYKLAKFLPRFGWKPFVLTVDTNYLYNEDRTLLEALPPEVEIVTARYVEPTVRGVRMALGGKDRTFNALKRRGEIRFTPDETGAESRQDRGRAFRSYLYERWLQSPDAYWTWYAPAVSAARRLIRRCEIPLVLTSANPYTCHRIGLTLQSEGCKWVADLRDPHTYCHHMHSRHAAVFARQEGLEEEAVRRADAVTVASSAIAMILSDSYGNEGARRARFIPTGLDEDLIPPAEECRPRPFPYLLFSGEFLPDYGSEFLEVFAAALDHADIRALGPKLLIIGRMDVNGPRVLPIVRRLGIEERVEFLDHIPQGELYRLLRGAEAGVLITARHFRWWCLYAKMVDYIALRKPVVALVPDPSEARTRLNQAGLGVFLDGDRSTCAATLAGFLLGRSRRPRPVAEECDRYLATSQVASFVEIFEDLLAPGMPHGRCGDHHRRVEYAASVAGRASVSCNDPIG
jgi:glycosyltransferase involved in cell wall biosynthesis